MVIRGRNQINTLIAQAVGLQSNSAFTILWKCYFVLPTFNSWTQKNGAFSHLSASFYEEKDARLQEDVAERRVPLAVLSGRQR